MLSGSPADRMTEKLDSYASDNKVSVEEKDPRSSNHSATYWLPWYSIRTFAKWNLTPQRRYHEYDLTSFMPPYRCDGHSKSEHINANLIVGTIELMSLAIATYQVIVISCLSSSVGLWSCCAFAFHCLCVYKSKNEEISPYRLGVLRHSQFRIMTS